MPPVSVQTSGPRYWRSLEELADAPEFRAFLESEFPSAAAEFINPTTRRQFLKLMGASVALAGLTGCRWPEEKIAPYASRPEDRMPGKRVAYATAMELGGVASGLLVTSYDGRPIKIEGNPSHPTNRGSTNAISQASILELYDPNRSQWALERLGSGSATARKPRMWDEFAAFAGPHFRALRNRGGEGLSVLSEVSSSPSLAAMHHRFAEAVPKAQWYEYEPLSVDNERQGAELVFGGPFRAHLHLNKADCIVSLDADLLMTHPSAVRHAREFAERRRAEDGTMNRLHVIESTLSVTGGAADHRYPVRTQDVFHIAARLVLALVEQGWSHPVLTDEVLSDLDGAEPTGVEASDLVAMARDLLNHRGRSVVVAGPRQAPEVHALVHVLNSGLDNVGGTVTYTRELDPAAQRGPGAIARLTGDMAAGKVDTLVILGGNPVYNAPRGTNSDAGRFGEALAAIGTSIHLALYDDETSRRCTWHLPRAHYLEAWGDARAYDGTVSIVQPLIEPLYGGRTPAELIALIVGDEITNAHDITRRTFASEFATSDDSDPAWRKALHDGLVEGTAWPVESPTIAQSSGPMLRPRLADRLRERRPARDGGYEVVFVPDHKLYDGRFANNGWLQELPDPITKLTWDNAALISPADALAMGITRSGEMIRIEHDAASLEIPVYLLPGQARGSITIPLGYGRKAAGDVAAGAGFDAYAIMPPESPMVLAGASVTRTERHYDLATTQDHHAMDSAVGAREAQKRVDDELVRVSTLENHKQHPKAGGHDLHVVPLWQEHRYDSGHQWGMAIDLSACTGCSACVVACQAENNIPVVGKDEVARGREMHWIRVDRYFKGEPESPRVEVVHQPVPCQHCENAPCEQVCPVAATVHSHEGLNDMVYNRCIGTRYCSNNCPYKVRRFNWFNNHKDVSEMEKMLFNPQVTVRSRGVMEKCTFCIQRISAVRIQAKNEGRPIVDGEITPACAQACPSQAIVFGDLNDPESRVARLFSDHRAYGILNAIYTRPRVRYLTRLTNPHSAIDDSQEGGTPHDDHGTA